MICSTTIDHSDDKMRLASDDKHYDNLPQVLNFMFVFVLFTYKP
jgi:hypothetical protein